MRAGFITSEVATGLRRNLTMTIAMVITTAIALTMLGAGLLVVRMADNSREKYEYLSEFRVYLSKEISVVDPDCIEPQCLDIRRQIEGTEGVESVSFMNPLEAFDEFKRLFEQSDPVLVQSTSPETLGSRFTVTLKDPSFASEVSKTLNQLQGTTALQGQTEVVERVFSIINGVRNAAFAIAIAQGVATILLIANMIQIAAFTRRTELGIMRLVGASRLTAQLPFILEAVAASCVGALTAVGGLFAVKKFFLDDVLSSVYEANLVSPLTNTDIAMVAPALIITGVVISAVTAVVTLRFYVRY